MSGQPFQRVSTPAQHQESAGTSTGREPGDQLSPATHSTDEEHEDRWIDGCTASCVDTSRKDCCLEEQILNPNQVRSNNYSIQGQVFVEYPQGKHSALAQGYKEEEARQLKVPRVGRTR